MVLFIYTEAAINWLGELIKKHYCTMRLEKSEEEKDPCLSVESKA